MAHVATLTIDHTKVDADLTDFPVLIIANGDAGWAELYNVATEGGGDIRIFKSDDTTELPREIVSFSVSAETGEIHVKYSGTLSSTVDTDIHIYADGVSADYAVGATYGRNAVWTSFRQVNHFQNNVTDSTGNLTGTVSGGAIVYTAQEIGQGGKFKDTTATKLSFGSVPIGFTTHMKTSFFMKPDTPNSNGMVYCKTNWVGAATDTFYVYFVRSTDTTGYFNVFVGNGSANQYRDFPVFSTVNRDKHDVIYDTTTREWKHYINGALVHTSAVGTISSINNASSQLLIGETPTPTASSLPFDGELDEMRLSGGSTHINSAGWVSTEYKNQSSPETFYSVTSMGVLEQALTATAQASASIVKQIQRDIAVTASATADFTRSIGRIITSTAQATASFVRSVGRTLQVTAQGSPTLQAGLLWAQELMATAQATASIAYTQVTIVALTVTAQASTAITQIYTRGVALVATAQAGVELARNSTLARTLVATASATASLVQSGLIISRELLVTASATVTYTLGKSLSTILTVTVGSVVSLLKDFGYVDKYPKNDATYEDKYPE